MKAKYETLDVFKWQNPRTADSHRSRPSSCFLPCDNDRSGRLFFFFSFLTFSSRSHGLTPLTPFSLWGLCCNGALYVVILHYTVIFSTPSWVAWCINLFAFSFSPFPLSLSSLWASTFFCFIYLFIFIFF